MNIKKFVTNTMYTFSANFVSFTVNALIILIIPKMIGISEYGYYQMYILLSTYTSYFHFGWCDGIYLRYVGKKYEELDKEMLASQFKGIVFLSLLLFFILGIVINTIFYSFEKRWIYYVASFAIIIVTPKTFTSVVMQMINRMEEYSKIVLIEKVVYIFVLITLLLGGVRNFRILILADIFGKGAALSLGIFYCKDIICTKIRRSHFRYYAIEARENIIVGIFLLISNLASVFITGVIQFSIETKWGIEAFSKVSLSFNLSKMLMVLITAMSVVLVPMLKHLKENELKNIYKEMRAILMFALGGALILYFPIKEILSIWLPQYEESLKYLALLFPMCLFEGKTSLLLNTYLKSMREEKKLCFINIMTVAVSCIIGIVTVWKIENFNVAIVAIPYLLAVRSFILEKIVGLKLHINVIKNASVEVMLVTCFIVFNWNLNQQLAIILYLFVYFVYVIYIKKDLKPIMNRINCWNKKNIR